MVHLRHHQEWIKKKLIASVQCRFTSLLADTQKWSQLKGNSVPFSPTQQEYILLVAHDCRNFTWWCRELNNFICLWDWKPAEHWRTWRTLCIYNIWKKKAQVWFFNAYWGWEDFFYCRSWFTLHYNSHNIENFVLFRPICPSEPWVQGGAIQETTCFTYLILNYT